MGRPVADSSNDLHPSLAHNCLTLTTVDCCSLIRKGRSFAKGVTCLCCMGGNCHAVGHILDDCECSCTSVLFVVNRENRTIARSFKYLYFEGQRGQYKKEESVLPGSWDEFLSQWGETLRLGNQKERRLVLKMKKGVEEESCRRFLSTIDGKIR